MDHPDQSYISYQDHCAFVAEFKRYSFKSNCYDCVAAVFNTNLCAIDYARRTSDVDYLSK